MSFNLLKDRTRERFTEVGQFLHYLVSNEPTATPATSLPIEINIAKGLFYVHLYSAIEKTINDLVETTLLMISSKNVLTSHYKPALLSLVLKDSINSVRDCSPSRMIEKSIILFKKTETDDVLHINESILGSLLQNIWMSTIDELFIIFDIGRPGFTPLERISIDEIVEKRNAIAHGRDSAATVGGRFRTSDLKRKYDATYNIVNRVIDDFENHYNQKGYVKMCHCANY